MILRTIYANGKDELEFWRFLRERGDENLRQAEYTVNEIIRRVQSEGDEAVRDCCLRFDGTCPAVFELSTEERRQAAAKASPELVRIMRKAADNIRAFHEKQLAQSYELRENGRVLGQLVRPLARVGLYVPGGTAAYPSSVLMNAVPAKLAGVKELVMVTPPKADGPSPNIMAAAEIAGVDRIFTVGGAQAVAALAFGTDSIPRCDKVVGPGNRFVATAKQLLYGTIDIDMIAGPSEILVVADDTADPAFVAADLLSQAEHDRQASAVLLCVSDGFAARVREELAKQLEALPRKEIAEASLSGYGALIVCPNVEQAVALSNLFAPEHLELSVENPEAWLEKVENAGSVFLGSYAPESLGDYLAGTNHVLPTGGTARFFSPLGVYDFVKRISYQSCTREAFALQGADVAAFAEAEGLQAHANAAKIRLD